MNHNSGSRLGHGLGHRQVISADVRISRGSIVQVKGFARGRCLVLRENERVNQKKVLWMELVIEKVNVSIPDSKIVLISNGLVIS